MTAPTILVATWNDGLVVINDGNRLQELPKQCVRNLAHDGAGGALAIVDHRSLLHRDANGAWSTLAMSDADLSCCIKVRDTIYVGTDDARVLRLNAQNTLEALPGFNSIAGRDTWYAGSAIVDGRRVGPPLGIRSMSAGADGKTIFANVHVGGIPRSTDGGKTWHPTIDIHTDVHQVAAHPKNPNAVIAASAVGLCVSNDAGATWFTENAGLHAPHCSAVQFVGEDILISASMSPFAPQGALYRYRAEGNGRFVKVTGGLPEWLDGKIDTNCIAAKESFVAIVDWGGHLYISSDAGHTWSLHAESLRNPASIRIL
jgi:BNR/Asp-box repeat